MSDAAKPEKSDAIPKSSPLRWILLALWLIWLGAMIAMSIPEWGKPRPVYKPAANETKGARN